MAPEDFKGTYTRVRHRQLRRARGTMAGFVAYPKANKNAERPSISKYLSSLTFVSILIIYFI
jgi:hypothetical protein